MKFALTACLLSFAWLFTGCGGGSKDPDVSVEPAPAPPPASAPQPPPDAKWDAVKALITANCDKCHTGAGLPAFDSAAAFKTSAAKARLTAGTMPPPPATISAADKAELLAYLGG